MVIVLPVLLIVGCKPVRHPTAEVQLFAASSLTAAVEEICSEFSRRHEIPVRINLAASSTLAQQIGHGARADLYISANQAWCDYLAERGEVAKQCPLVGNRLVIAVPAQGEVVVQQPTDLLSAGVRRLAIADPDSVPAGIYAKRALQNLGVWNSLQEKLVVGRDVRQVLAYVETGNVDAGLVYATDAANSQHVRVAYRVPAGQSDPIRYPLALLKRSEHKRVAIELYDFMMSPAAAEIFRRHGFEWLGSTPDD